MSSAVISASGEHDARTYGHYKVVLSLPVDGGFAINTFTATGSHRYNELSFTTGDVDTANLAHRIIKTGGEQGISPEGIHQALTDALVRELHEVQARRDRESRTRIEHINALLDRLESPADTAAIEVLAESVRRNLTEVVPAGRQPQVARSRSGVEHKPLSAPQQRIAAGHTNGVVRAGRGVGWLTLQSIARKGYAEVIARSGQKVTAIRLNQRGLDAVERPVTAADLPTTRPAEIAVHRDSGAYVATVDALNRYRPDVDWLPLGRPVDDDTHIIVEVDGEPMAIVKTMTLVVRGASVKAVA